MAPAKVYRYWVVVHGWGCIGGVVVLGVISLLVVAMPVVLEEGSSSLVIEVLKQGSSCEAFL